MAVGKEIRGKIKSVENTKKITKAMEMVAASKMRKAQERMRAARPYADKIRNITAHLSQANPEYKLALHARGRDAQGSVGFIVVSTDKGLCGGLNTNVLRAVTSKMKDVQAAGASVEAVAIGNKGFSFLNRIGATVVSHAVQLGDAPQLDKLIGPVKVMLDAFAEGRLDAVLPVLHALHQHDEAGADGRAAAAAVGRAPGADRGRKAQYGWDYIYEPDAPSVIDDLLTRYIEALVYQAVAENMASASKVGPHGGHEGRHRQRRHADR